MISAHLTYCRGDAAARRGSSTTVLLRVFPIVRYYLCSFVCGERKMWCSLSSAFPPISSLVSGALVKVVL